MPTCQKRLSNGEMCPKPVAEGTTLCKWHDPDDESWREVYERLEKATPDERINIVIESIADHPEHILELPKRNGIKPNLSSANFSRENILEKIRQFDNFNPSWIITADGYTNLTHVDLNGANLTETNLEEANLCDADLHDAICYMANLQKTNLSTSNLQDTVFAFANLQNTDLRFANLQGSDLFSAILKGADLGHANLQRANVMAAKFQDANLSGSQLQGVDFSFIENMFNVFVKGVWLDRTRIPREKLGGKIGEEQEKYYHAAKQGYLGLKQNFDDLGDYDSAGWAYCKERRMEKLEAKQNGRDEIIKREWIKAIRSYAKFIDDQIVEWLCDYGESVGRVIGWLLFLTLVVGPLLFSWLGRQEWNAELLKSYNALPFTWQQFLFRYSQFMVYTFDTLTTANFSGIQPMNTAFKLASGLFAFIGIFLAGLLGFVAGNRIRRS